MCGWFQDLWKVVAIILHSFFTLLPWSKYLVYYVGKSSSRKPVYFPRINYLQALAELSENTFTIFTRMEDGSNLRWPPQKTCLPKENVYIETSDGPLNKNICLINILLLILYTKHVRCYLPLPISVHYFHLHSQCLHLLRTIS